MNTQELTEFIRLEMYWNVPSLVISKKEHTSHYTKFYYKNATVFLLYECLPGQSVIKELKDTISKTPYECYITRYLQSRSGDEHSYFIQLRLK